MNLFHNGVWSNALHLYKKYASGAPGLKPPKAYWNWIRANYEMGAQTSHIKARPLRLNIDATNACQLSCPICPTGLKVQDRPMSHLDQELFQSLLEEVGDFVFFIDFFNWGEPLVSNKIEGYVEIANRKKIWTTISTNLSLPLSDQRIQKIIESGLSELIVSADGASPETYAMYRRGGDFELVMRNMQRFVNMKKQLGRKNPLIIWRFLVFGFNENEIEKASNLAIQLEVDQLVFAPPYVDHERFPDWIPKNPKFQMKRPQDRAESTSLEAGIFQLSSSTQKPSREEHRNRCDWHYVSAAINPDGSIAPCCALFSKKDDFASFTGKEGGGYMVAVNNEKYRTVRDRFAGRINQPVDLVCEHCPTPEIMDYGKQINLMIPLLTAVQCLEAIKRFISAPFRLITRSN